MHNALYIAGVIFTGTFKVLLAGIEISMLLRAVLSFFDPMGQNGIQDFLLMVTEPFVVPVRAILERFDFVAESPIDISFFVSYFMISLMGIFLPKL